MYSFYGKLFKYRQSELRTPREDYLTECLADLFGRLPLARQVDFASRIFVPRAAQGVFSAFASGIDSFRLETQRQIPSGRIDLVLHADDKPIAAIENKIAAELPDDQLASYGRWIKRASRSGPLSIVCLLTHLTPPPAGFELGGDASGQATPHVAKWSSVGGVLLEYAETAGLPDDVRMLARELRRFLEECDMSGEYAGRDEFAAALVYLRAGARMDHTFSSIFAHIKSKEGCFRKNETKNEYSLKFDSPFKLIWGWSYLSHPTLNQLFLGYGIALEPDTAFTSGGLSSQARIPKADSAFICVGADDKKSIQAIRQAKQEPQKPWTYAEIGNWVAIISFKPLHDLMADPQSFTRQMTAWIDDEASDVSAYVKSLKSTA